MATEFLHQPSVSPVQLLWFIPVLFFNSLYVSSLYQTLYRYKNNHLRFRNDCLRNVKKPILLYRKRGWKDRFPDRHRLIASRPSVDASIPQGSGKPLLCNYARWFYPARGKLRNPALPGFFRRRRERPPRKSGLHSPWYGRANAP